MSLESHESQKENAKRPGQDVVLCRCCFDGFVRVALLYLSEVLAALPFVSTGLAHSMQMSHDRIQPPCLSLLQYLELSRQPRDLEVHPRQSCHVSLFLAKCSV